MDNKPNVYSAVILYSKIEALAMWDLDLMDTQSKLMSKVSIIDHAKCCSQELKRLSSGDEAVIEALIKRSILIVAQICLTQWLRPIRPQEYFRALRLLHREFPNIYDKAREAALEVPAIKRGDVISTIEAVCEEGLKQEHDPYDFSKFNFVSVPIILDDCEEDWWSLHNGLLAFTSDAELGQIMTVLESNYGVSIPDALFANCVGEQFITEAESRDIGLEPGQRMIKQSKESWAIEPIKTGLACETAYVDVKGEGWGVLLKCEDVGSFCRITIATLSGPEVYGYIKALGSYDLEKSQIEAFRLGRSLQTATERPYTFFADRATRIQARKRVPAAVQNNSQEVENDTSSDGCYVATAVYGSYDCPQVWTLRRYRDHELAKTRRGRAFIKTYYAISPTLVKWFGGTKWFKKMWQGSLDRLVAKCKAKGFEDTPYQDKNW